MSNERKTDERNEMSQRKQGVSQKLDELSSTLVGDALDLLAAGHDVNVLLVVQDDADSIMSIELADDDPEMLLITAYDRVKELKRKHGDESVGIGEPIRYAIVYEAMIADDDGVYRDALMLEFGERGWEAYSAYSLFEGKGAGEDFAWTEPAPAGEVESLL